MAWNNPFVPQQALPDTSNQLTASAPNSADAWQANAAAYQQWADAQRKDGIARGLIDPETGWPTGAALVDAAHQYGGALLGSTAAPGIRAFHGSPHSFDQFQSSAIGTGEGAAAYGHGLYFAGDENVAKSYRDTLAGDGFLTADGKVFDPSTLQHMNVRSTVARTGDLDAGLAAS